MKSKMGNVGIIMQKFVSLSGMKGWFKKGLLGILLTGMAISTGAAEAYITENGFGGGTSWNDAASVVSLQALLDANDVVNVAGGTYTLPTASITLKSGKKLIGGFNPDGSGARPLSDRNANGVISPWEFEHETIFDGGKIDRSCFISTETTTYDGISIRNALSTNTSKNNGAAIQGVSGTGLCTIENCTFYDNNSTYYWNNKATDDGGVVYIGGPGKDNVNGGIVRNCYFYNNQTEAGILFYDNNNSTKSSLTVENCHFVNNKSRRHGTLFLGHYSTKGLEISVSGCLFANNEALNGSAIMFHSTPGRGGANYAKINNCTFVNNKTTAANSGAIQCTSTSDETAPSAQALPFPVSFNNCLFRENRNPSGIVSIKDQAEFSSTGVNTFLLNNTMMDDTFRTFIMPAMTADPFVKSITTIGPTTDDEFKTANWRLKNDAEPVNKGSNSFVTIEKDLDGQPRIFNQASGGIADCGAYELQAQVFPNIILNGASTVKAGARTSITVTLSFPAAEDVTVNFSYSDQDFTGNKNIVIPKGNVVGTLILEAVTTGTTRDAVVSILNVSAGVLMGTVTSHTIKIKSLSDIPEVKHIVLFGLDGLGANYIGTTALPWDAIPAFKKLRDSGIYSMRLRSILPVKSTNNWASMFMGAGLELHGFTDDGGTMPDIVPRLTNKNGMFPNIFSELSEQRPTAKMAYYYKDATINRVIDMPVIQTVVDCTAPGKSPVTEAAKQWVAGQTPPELTFIYYNDPDVAGHANGWGTTEYNDAIKRMDAELAKLTDAIEKSGKADETLIIVVSGHGGEGKNHGTNNMVSASLNEMEAPFIMAGAGIDADPNPMTESINVYDIAPLLAQKLKIAVPQAWIGRVIPEAELEITPPKKAEHMLIIGLDGFGGQYVKWDELPNIRSLRDRGAFTTKMRCAMTSSSGINWSSLFTGVGPSLHGFTDAVKTTQNLTPRVTAIGTSERGMFPTIFSSLNHYYPDSSSTGVFDWYNGTQGVFNYMDKNAITDAVSYTDNSIAVADKAIEQWNKYLPTLAFVYFHSPDIEGHAKGWGTAAYYEAVRKVDIEVGRILDNLEKSGIADKTMIILTADHGGSSTSHGKKELNNLEVPFLMCGPGVIPGEINEIMTNIDVCATMYNVIGLPKPQAVVGRAVPMTSHHNGTQTVVKADPYFKVDNLIQKAGSVVPVAVAAATGITPTVVYPGGSLPQAPGRYTITVTSSENNFFKAGSQEYTLEIINPFGYVTADGKNKKDGSSWENAADSTAVQSLLNTADTVYVAGGVYPVTASIKLNSGKYIIGGLNPENGERPLKDRNGDGVISPWEFEYETIFDGGKANRSCFISAGTTTYDGITVRNAYCTVNNGAAIQGVSGNGHCTIENCTFYDNNSTFWHATNAIDEGGIVYIGGLPASGSNPLNGGTVRNCYFYNNQTEAGILFYDNNSGTKTSLTVENCHFANNVSRRFGTLFLGHFATLGLQINISGCLFANNKAPKGSAIMFHSTDPRACLATDYAKINNCTFVNNQATAEDAGAIQCTSGKLESATAAKALPFPVSVNNCLFYENRNPADIVSIKSQPEFSESLFTLENCMMDDAAGFRGMAVPKLYKLVEDPFQSKIAVIGPTADMTFQTANWRLKAGAFPVDKGNNNFVIIFTDLDGNPRIDLERNKVDCGAYELPWIPPRSARFVTPNGDGDGTSWLNAAGGSTAIQTFINIPSVDTIFIMDGVYAGSFTADFTALSRSRLALLGGYNSAGIKDPTSVTILRRADAAKALLTATAAAKVSNELYIQGVTFDGDKLAGAVTAVDLTGLTVHADSCRFTRCYGATSTYHPTLRSKSGDIYVTRSWFDDNAGIGGIAYNDNNSSDISKFENCLFAGNRLLTVTTPSGVMSIGKSQTTLTNCIFANNSVPGTGAGAKSALISGLAAAKTNITFQNCTIANNNNSYIYAPATGTTPTCYLYNSLISGNTHDGLENITTPLGNVTIADPLFVNKTAFQGNSGTQMSDILAANWRVKPKSTAINAGDNTYAVDITKDMDGNDRIFAGDNVSIVDCGAYEYSAIIAPSVCYVTPNGSGNKDGSSWGNAIAGAAGIKSLTLNPVVDTVYIANGTYAVGCAIDLTGEKRYIAWIGGFNEDGIKDPAGKTVIISESTTLDVVTATGTNKETSFVHFEDITFDGQQVTSDRRVLYLIKVDALVKNCHFTGHWNSGKYKYCIAAPNTRIRIFNSAFTDNDSLGSPVFANDYKTDNEVLFENCIISGNRNSKDGSGAAIIFQGGVAVMRNCIMANNNFPKTDGGGIFYVAKSGVQPTSVKMYNMTFVNNNTDAFIYTYGSPNLSCVTLHNSLIAGNTVNTPNTGVNNLSSWTGTTEDAKFLEPTATQGYLPPATILAANWRLDRTSPAINAGNNEHVNFPYDMDGTARIFNADKNGIVDCGAYEYAAPPPTVTAIQFFPPANLVYDGTVKSINVKLTLDPTWADEPTYEIDYNTPPLHAGNYTATFRLTGESATDYRVTANTQYSFTIATAPLTVTVNPVAKFFNDPLPTFSVSGNGWRGPEVANPPQINAEFACSATQTSDAGSYPVTASNAVIASQDYHVIDYTENQLTINPKRITADVITVAPPPPESLIYDGEQKSVEVQLPEPFTTSDYTVSYIGDRVNAGTVTATVTVQGNYTADVPKSIQFEIMPKAVSLVLKDTQTIYNGLPQTVKCEAEGVKADEISVRYQRVTDGKVWEKIGPADADTYLVTASIREGNYTGSAADTFIIAPLNIADSVYFTELNSTYNAVPHAVTLKFDKISYQVLDSEYTVTYDGVPDSPVNAGTYQAEAIFSGNFCGRHTNAMTIQQSPVTVAAMNELVNHGTKISALRYKSTGTIYPKDAFSGELSTLYTDRADVGDYKILQGTLTLGLNYLITFIPGNIHVSQAEQRLRVSPTDLRMTLGDGPLELSLVTYGESGNPVVFVSSAPQTVTVTDSGVLTFHKIGTAVITLTQAGNINYFPAPPATVNVTVSAPPVPPDAIVFTDTQRIYSGERQTVGYVLNDLLPDSVSIEYQAGDGPVYHEEGPSFAGIYKVTIRVTDPNLSGLAISDFVIAPFKIESDSVYLIDKTTPYDGKPQSLTVVLDTAIVPMPCDTDYIMTFNGNNKKPNEPDEYDVVLLFQGNYSGTAFGALTILPPPPPPEAEAPGTSVTISTADIGLIPNGKKPKISATYYKPFAKGNATEKPVKLGVKITSYSPDSVVAQVTGSVVLYDKLRYKSYAKTQFTADILRDYPDIQKDSVFVSMNYKTTVSADTTVTVRMIPPTIDTVTVVHDAATNTPYFLITGDYFGNKPKVTLESLNIKTLRMKRQSLGVIRKDMMVIMRDRSGLRISKTINPGENGMFLVKYPIYLEFSDMRYDIMVDNKNGLDAVRFK